jgi:hypothetical protein
MNRIKGEEEEKREVGEIESSKKEEGIYRKSEYSL